MRNKQEFIDIIDNIRIEEVSSVKEIAHFLNEKENTVKGWLSDEMAFPVQEFGARRARKYSKSTVIQIIVYAVCMKNDGLQLSSAKIKRAFSTFDSALAMEHFRQSANDVVNYVGGLPTE